MSDTVYELKIDLPEGDPIQIPGLGTFEPGKTYEITKAEADGYREFWKRNGQLGATLLQASKSMHNVIVTVPESDKKPSESGKKSTEGGAQ